MKVTLLTLILTLTWTLTPTSAAYTKSTLALSSTQWVRATHDVNSDGQLDILTVPDRGASSALLYLSDGSGGYTSPPTTIPGSNTRYVADFGYIDGDAHVDLVLTRDSPAISWMKGDGSGTFSSETTISTLAYATYDGFHVANLDGTNNDDVVFAPYTLHYGGLYLFLNDKESNFFPSNLPFPNIPCHMIAKNGNVCQRLIDGDLFHCTSGCHMLRQRAHSVLAWAMTDVLRSMGHPVNLAPTIPGQQRKADFISHGISWDHNFSTAVDVSVRAPFAAGAFPPDRPRHHLRRAESSKMARYSNAYGQMGSGFIPFVISSTGILGDEAKDLIGKLAIELSLRTFTSRSQAAQHISLYIRSMVLRQVAFNSLQVRKTLATRLAND